MDQQADKIKNPYKFKSLFCQSCNEVTNEYMKFVMDKHEMNRSVIAVKQLATWPWSFD